MKGNKTIITVNNIIHQQKADLSRFEPGFLICENTKSINYSRERNIHVDKILKLSNENYSKKSLLNTIIVG